MYCLLPPPLLPQPRRKGNEGERKMVTGREGIIPEEPQRKSKRRLNKGTWRGEWDTLNFQQEKD